MVRRRDDELPKRRAQSTGVSAPPGGSSGSNAKYAQGSKPKAKAKPAKNPAGYGKQGFKPLAAEKRGKEAAVKRRQPNYSGKTDQSGQSMTRGEVRKKTAARVAEAKPDLKGKALKTRVNKQTSAAVQRRQDRGMKVTTKKKDT